MSFSSFQLNTLSLLNTWNHSDMKLYELYQEPIKETKFVLKESGSGLDLSSMNFALGSIFPSDAQGSGINPTRSRRVWRVGLGVADEVAEFTSERDANAFVRALRESDDFGTYFENGFASERTRVTPAELDKLRNRVTSASGRLKTFSRGVMSAAGRMAARGSYLTFASLENIPRAGPTLTKILASPWWKGFFRAVAAAGLTVSVYTSIIGVINDLETEAERGEISDDEALELRNILLGQLSIQVLAFWVAAFRNARTVARVISAVRFAVRAAQGATIVAGAAAAPATLGSSLLASGGAILSFLVTEAGFWGLQYLLTRPEIQRGLAEWLHGNMFGDIVGAVGMATAGAITVAEEVFQGDFGTGALRRAIGFEEGENEEINGEVWASSEWAKLVFHNLLFPSNERIVVPYIAPDRREALINERLGIEALPTTGQTNRENNPFPAIDPNASPEDLLPPPTPTSEPGLPTNPDARPGPQ